MDKARQIGYAKILLDKARNAMSGEGMTPETEKQAEAHNAINDAYNKIIPCYYEASEEKLTNEEN